MSWSDVILSAAQRQLVEAIELRRDLHRHPELGNDLPETRQRVLDALSGLGLEIELSGRTSSFVATLSGASPGRVLMLRADMDALPMPEDTELEFASEIPGRMHACGHDAHTAMLVAAAHVLAQRRDELAGELRFFFQSGEEGHFGAKISLDEGLLDTRGAPEAAFALHIDPRLPKGCVAARSGSLLASADSWTIEIEGKGGHASMPHLCIDPIPVACEIVTSLQTMVTRRINAFDPVVLTATTIEAGTTNNVIPERAIVTGTLRATSEHARMKAEEGIHRVVYGIAEAHGVASKVDIQAGYPVTVNDEEFTRFAKAVAHEVLGDAAFIEMPTPVMGAEDFSYLLERWPGAMFFIGMCDREISDPAPVHSNRMVLDEEGMRTGIALHAGLALRFLHSSEG
jgi:hippurate hydrolase